MATLQEAIKYATDNPETPFANELRKRIESGSFNNELQQMRQPAQPQKDSTFGTLTGPLREGVSGLGTLYGGSEQGIASKLYQNVQAGAKDIQAGGFGGDIRKANLPLIAKGVAKAGFRTAGDVAGTIYAPIGAAIGATGIGKLTDWLGGTIANSSLMNKITDIPAVQEFAVKHPNAGEDFGRALNLIFAAKEKGKIEPSTVIPRTTTQIGDVRAKTSAVYQNYRANQSAKDVMKMDKLTGMITQGKIEDVAKAKQALSNLDTQGIKTYSDLTDTLNAKIDTLSSKLNQTLQTNPKVRTTNQLKVGSFNYVQEAIGQLKDFYTKTNNARGLQIITQLENKANSTGLTIADMNNLAIRHGQDLNAYNANNQLASGLSKQAAENTRMGVKNTARQLFNDPIYNAVDSELANLIRTRDLTKKMSQEVVKLQQKVQTRGWGERTGRLVGKLINTMGLNSPKGLIEYFLARGTGLKTLNALDLEAGLKKNLVQLQKLTSGKIPESEAIKIMNEMITSYQKEVAQRKMLPAPKAIYGEEFKGTGAGVIKPDLIIPYAKQSLDWIERQRYQIKQP